MSYSVLFRKFRDKHILVIGDLIFDHYIWGLVERISPEAPVPVVDVRRETHALGGAANVAANIVALGGKATIVGVRGDDIYGELLDSMLENRGIDVSGLFTGKRPTTVKTRVIAHSQQMVRFDREERKRISEKTFKKMMDYMSSSTGKWDAIIVSDYKKGVVSGKMMTLLMEEFKKRGVFIAVDPKVGHYGLYRGVSLITPNAKEASAGAGVEIKDDRTLSKAGKKLLSKLGCDSVLITRGEHGMNLFEEKAETHIPTAAKSVYDVSGAGDTVIATITLAHSAGTELRDAAVIANHAAGIVVSQLGTATTTAKQVMESLKGTGKKQ